MATKYSCVEELKVKEAKQGVEKAKLHLADMIYLARSRGYTWMEIASWVGVTTQAVHSRYSKEAKRRIRIGGKK